MTILNKTNICETLISEEEREVWEALPVAHYRTPATSARIREENKRNHNRDEAASNCSGVVIFCDETLIGKRSYG